MVACLLSALLAVSLGGCGDDRLNPILAREVPELQQCEFELAWTIEVVAEQLEVPWDIEVAPDARIFVTERPGRVRIIENGVLLDEPWLTIDVASVGVIGLTGLALDPDFETNRYVYVALQYERRMEGALGNFALRLKQGIASVVGSDERFAYFARVLRFTDDSGQAIDPVVILDGIPSDPWHGTVSLDFGPDGNLYASTGYATDSKTAQDPRSLGGKLIRLALSADRKFERYEIVASGLRQSQGMAWTSSGHLVMTEHGQAGYDELNAIRESGNYGWPQVAGPVDDPRYQSPIVTWRSGIAPSGIGVLPWSADPATNESLLVAGLKGRDVKLIPIRAASAASGFEPICQQDLFPDRFGRIRAVHVFGQREALISTSNRDFRGQSKDGDDRILKLVAMPRQ